MNNLVMKMNGLVNAWIKQPRNKSSYKWMDEYRNKLISQLMNGLHLWLNKSINECVNDPTSK